MKRERKSFNKEFNLMAVELCQSVDSCKLQEQLIVWNKILAFQKTFLSSKFLPFRFLSIIIFLFHLLGNSELQAQRLSRDLNVSLLINQVGYMPKAEKLCITKGDRARTFEVIELETQQVVFTGTLKPNSGDFGEYLTGNFSALTQEGHYYVKSDTLRSYPFEISNDIYQSPMGLIVHYFSKQRCGPSATGYLSPCHIDDGIRLDNGKHQDVSGGWHDASDLRKWVGATIYGMIGLAKTYELSDGRQRDKILEELKWGNRYFLKMQEPDGYIMNYIGGDVKKHSDSNRWTDNEIGEEGGEVGFVKPNAGKSHHDMLIFGSNDDRVIQTDALGILGQYNFITAEALMARITKDIDDKYAQKCLEAAKKCFDWCRNSKDNNTPGTLGASIQASLELYKTTGKKTYKRFAIKQAARLQKLQSVNMGDEVSGFFFTNLSDDQPYKNVWNGCLEFISICDLIQTFPLHKDVSIWREMILNYSENYFSLMTKRNSFGIISFGLYTSKDPGGNRKIGKYWYRYFMQPELDWWVGINANLASAGIGMVKAAHVLDDREMMAQAQRQLDWIIGVNPFNSSTMVGVGHNHPKHFPGSSFYPLTPVIPGAVLNGLGGDHEDQPSIGDANWQISEYWTPMVSYTLWLMAELSGTNYE